MSHKGIYFILISLWTFSCGSKQEENKNNADSQDTTQIVQKQTPIKDTQNAPSIIDMLNTSENFRVFASYLTKDLSEMLATEEVYTVLVPTNQAIEKLGEAKMTNLLSQGASFIKAHIIKGKFDFASLQKTPEITTLKGKKIKITVSGNDVVIGDAKIVVANIDAKNGVIHAIDRVIE